MRRNIAFLVLTLSLLAPSITFAQGPNIKKPVQLVMNPDGSGDYDCPSDGSGCTLEIGDCPNTSQNGTVTIVSSPSGLNWVISGTISCASKNRGTGPISLTGFSPANYTFPAGFTMIVTSGMFPGVPPMNVSMSGVTTNSAGYYSFSIPK